jgi:transposase
MRRLWSCFDPGVCDIRRAYVWTCARGAFDTVPGEVYDFCLARGAKYPIAFLCAAEKDANRTPSWRDTLVRDEYKAYEKVLVAEPGRTAARCLAHARRKFNEFLRDNGRSAVAKQALQPIPQIYGVERELAVLTSEERLTGRNIVMWPL